MGKRYVSIWFHHLRTDWFSLRDPVLKTVPFVLSLPSHGKMIITAANPFAEAQGIGTGMAVADARALLPGLKVMDDIPDLSGRLLKKIAAWCIRFTPVVAVDGEDGLLMDVTGCSNLWDGDYAYVAAIVQRLRNRGYGTKGAVADTIGCAWAVARYDRRVFVIEPGKQKEALGLLPPSSLRLEPEVIDRLNKLGLRFVRDFISMPPSSLRRRFGQHTIRRINQAVGSEMEIIEPLIPVPEYEERLPCFEPISTATGIEIGLKRLLEALCNRLKQEELGLRKAIFRCYRTDGKTEIIEIGTSRPSFHTGHLFKLFETKIPGIAPGPGIELFVLEAPVTESHTAAQEKLWETPEGLQDHRLSELIDRLAGRIGSATISRFLPDEHYWPERSIKKASSLEDQPVTAWRTDRPRPLQLLHQPERIEVTAPIPDYPPMHFRLRGQLHKIVKADGPERIEQEWWIQQREHRDYYYVEDENAKRYWLFRSGHYSGDKSPDWFLHGFFP
ncbi:MAG: DNA polymerase Y family protein [Chitinophagaceae bacterium]|nr:MAG: DNA polymerase Y family protein [Chitinophagaceae bacterium]